ncbi:hypothetical protein KR52_04235 [Synechococcus sp. KORDI-52]|nr:hypothetical protein KR52_04235 [Synechococcus sp. KORDI-52]
MNPAGDQHDPGEGDAHQQGSGEPLAGTTHQGPEPEGKQQQPTVFSHQQQQSTKQPHPPMAAVEETSHHQKRQQGQPDQIVKVLESRAYHRTAEEVREGDSLSQGPRKSGVGQSPQHQTCASEQAHLKQRQRPHPEPSHQGGHEHGQDVGMLPQVQVIDGREAIADHHRPRQHR